MIEHATVLASVVLIDLVLAGDNAIIVGLAAAGLPQDQRRRAILLGIVAALVCRVVFSLVAIQLLAIIGLTLAGGILLLWVAWKMAREIQAQRHQAKPFALGKATRLPLSSQAVCPPEGKTFAPSKKSRLPPKTFRSAAVQIAVADITMSLDNVLAVAGASQDHPWIMAFGLVLSVALMGAAAEFVARILMRWHWLAYIGLAVVSYVAVSMIWRGSQAVVEAFAPFAF